MTKFTACINIVFEAISRDEAELVVESAKLALGGGEETFPFHWKLDEIEIDDLEEAI